MLLNFIFLGGGGGSWFKNPAPVHKLCVIQIYNMYSLERDILLGETLNLRSLSKPLDLPQLHLYISLGISFWYGRVFKGLYDHKKGRGSATSEGRIFFNTIFFVTLAVTKQ